MVNTSNINKPFLSLVSADPCIANEDEMRKHNITFKSSDHNKYLVHDEMVEFKCARGLPVGKVAMSQRCNSGVVVLPTCREDVN